MISSQQMYKRWVYNESKISYFVECGSVERERGGVEKVTGEQKQ